ncbi:hypothetical protein OIU77_010502 [Salix suchowensis]|uniref:Maturase K n=1 Tax=Salix suchowensis TaxID=1278906 RepID=A0ABQ9A8L7_9ROSI|nr:hypothetical protein OIU77_010502 [Salix suchowensis]KAJ6328829.1 hypothetical protein OIU77_010502 [Salix suchowensis]
MQEPLLRKFDILSGFANICNDLETFLHVCSPSPFTHRWNHPVFSSLDHLSLTHFHRPSYAVHKSGCDDLGQFVMPCVPILIIGG